MGRKPTARWLSLSQNMQNSMLEQMIVALENGERIEIRGFGNFTLRHQSVRLARNPKTGESINSPAKVRLYFNPGNPTRT